MWRRIALTNQDDARHTVESWMWEHTLSHHVGEMGPDQGARDYAFRLQGRFYKTLERQVDEAVRLSQVDQEVLDDVGGRYDGTVVSLDSRGEYFRPKIMQYNFEN